MPIYEFRCSKCGEFFELLVFPGDVPACPQCGDRKVEKAMSACVARTSGEAGGAPGCSSCKGGNCTTCRPGRG